MLSSKELMSVSDLTGNNALSDSIFFERFHFTFLIRPLSFMQDSDIFVTIFYRTI